MKNIISSLVLVILHFVFVVTINAQSVGVGTTTPSASAKLDITSTSQGLLIPRVTTSQRNTISNPTTGLMVFDTDKRTVYLFDGTKWYPMLFTTVNTKIPLSPVSASDGLTGDAFGNSVAISGNYAVVGAYNNDVASNNNQGSAYIFYRENGAWIQQAVLLASNGAALDVFGSDVAISETGDHVVVGARQGPGPNHANQGAAYVFSRTGTTWTQIAILTASDGLSNDWFGNSVSIYGDYIAIGAQNANVDVFFDAGAVYVFYKGSGWVNNQPHQEKLTASDLMSTDNFGSDVSLYLDQLAVGASGDEDPGVPDKGAAYIFSRTGTDWSQLAKLTASDGTQYDYYGGSLSLYNDYLVVGTFISDIPGAAYVYFKGAAWVNGQAHQARLTGPDAISGEFFGNSVSLHGDYAIIGCSYKDVGSNNEQGAAYLFKRTGTTWNFARRLDDESGHVNEFFGGAVAINGFNLAVGTTGKNSNKGEVQFLNIE